MNLPFMAQLIDKETDLIDYYIFNKMSDAIICRQLGISKRILVIYAVTPSEAVAAAEYDIEIDCPSIEWLNITLNLISNKKLKVHVWYDSQLGREGIIDTRILFNLLAFIKSCDSIELCGIATKFNPNTSGQIIRSDKLRRIKLKDRQFFLNKLIKGQINKFNEIVKYIKDNRLLNNKTIIHAACSNEVISKYDIAHYDMVRVGGCVFQYNFENFIPLQVEITHIKVIPKGHCMGYYCKDGSTTYDLVVAYIKHPDLSNIHIKFNDTILKPIDSGDPYGLIINDFKDIIKVGDKLKVYLNMYEL